MKAISTLLVLVAVFIFTKADGQLSVSCGQQSVYWSDTFGGPITNWSATNGVWQIGTPTNPGGANGAHSGVTCAVTNLSGNYPVGVFTRLVNNIPIKIPSKIQNPRLRFWQWYSFSTTFGQDIGSVQIKTASSGWIPLANNYVNTSSGVWSRDEIDLSAFADSLVQIGFLIQDIGGNSTVSSGWYIDDIEIITGPYIFFNHESFENSWRDWSADGTWEIGIPTVGPTTGCSGPRCAGTNLGGNYAVGVAARLKSPWVKLPALNPFVTFCHWFSLSTTFGSDVGKLQFRTNKSGWRDTATYTGSSTLWTHVFLNMSAYADSVVQFGFFIQDIGGNSTVSSGWYIDSFNIAGLPDTSCYPCVTAPPQPIIAMTGYTLGTTYGAVSYQWYLNGNPISGATSASYNVTQNGSYYVLVTNSGGCTGASNFIQVSNVGLASLPNAANSVRLYPNPSSGVVYVKAPCSVNIIIRSMEGRKVSELRNVNEFNVEPLADGLYMIGIYTVDGAWITSEKLIKGTK